MNEEKMKQKEKTAAAAAAAKTTTPIPETEMESAAASVRKPFPKSVIFIIGNEFCERFSFYGMRTILVLYLTGRLGYSDDQATIAFHMFVMACYFTPLIGAVLADSFWGRYWTILVISSIYAAGSVVIAFASVAASVVLTMIGLALIAMGTGGIKPCVSAFGGDQFERGQDRQLKRFFSFFYLAINSGGLLSTAITPIFRDDIRCMGDKSCYPLAFGVPAALMIVAVLLFVTGRFTSGYRILPPQKDNILVSVVRCTAKSIWRKITSSSKKEHWLDHARGDFDDQTIHDVKALMGILFLFIPIPIFWALFDQQSSRWTLQAQLLNGDLGFYTIKPDQIQVINPILIVSMIPVFDYAIYPMLNRIGLKRPLRRMVVGGLLAGLAFVVCGLLQTRIESETPVPMTAGNNHMILINGNPGPLERADGYLPEMHPIMMDAYQMRFYTNLPREILNETQQKPIPLSDGQTLVVFFRQSQSTVFTINDSVLVKPKNGGARITTVYCLHGHSNNNQTLFRAESKDIDSVMMQSFDNGTESLGLLKTFELAVKGKPVAMTVGQLGHTDYLLDQGASYVQLIVQEPDGKLHFGVQEVVRPNQMSVFMQLFQYLLITCAEIMFSVTGLEFCYSQAPKSMKSVIQAAWLLTVTIGNLLVAIIADTKMFEKQSYEFFFFGMLMFVDMGLFAWIAYYYVPYTAHAAAILDELPPHPVPPLIAAVEGELPELVFDDYPVADDEDDYHQNTINRLSKL